jgi:dynein heavy chain
LFFALNDLVNVDPMYQFSLEAYIQLFAFSIEKSAEKNPNGGNLEERVSILNHWHTLAVYRYACRGLFERHKALLSLHIASRILQSENDLNQVEYQFFLRGGQVLDRSSQSPNPAPDWLSTQMWDNVTELEKIEAFKGFQPSFEQSLRDWRKWYLTGGEPEKEPLPGEWESRLDPLQRLCVIRSIRTDRVLPATMAFVAKKVDPKLVEPPPFDLDAIYEDSNCRSPLIFILSPGMDPSPLIRSLSVSKGVAWQSLSLGQGQAPKATRMLEEGTKAGFWVFLANCHLSTSWLTTLEKLVEEFVLNRKPEITFRLWLSSDPTPKFPITLLQRCVKMTTEPPT